MSYVDGFVLVVPRKNLAAYRRMAKKACRVWMDHGAMEYRECVGDDLKVKGMVTFPVMAKCKPSETVVFAWITYRSRKHRDAVNAKVMKDPRLAAMMPTDAKKMPFDCSRMAYGGFKTIVSS